MLFDSSTDLANVLVLNLVAISLPPRGVVQNASPLICHIGAHKWPSFGTETALG